MCDKMTFSSESEREAFILENMALVPFSLKKYGIPITDDNLQEGYIGLIKSVNNFDESKNIKFSTYAINNIALYVKNYIRLHTSIIKPLRHDNNLDYPEIYSLNAYISNKDIDTKTTLEDILVFNNYNSEYLFIDNKLDLYNKINSLKNRDKDILKLYMKLENQKAVAKKLNISRATVNKVLKRIRNIIKEER